MAEDLEEPSYKRERLSSFTGNENPIFHLSNSLLFLCKCAHYFLGAWDMVIIPKCWLVQQLHENYQGNVYILKKILKWLPCTNSLSNHKPCLQKLSF